MVTVEKILRQVPNSSDVKDHQHLFANRIGSKTDKDFTDIQTKSIYRLFYLIIQYLIKQYPYENPTSTLCEVVDQE